MGFADTVEALKRNAAVVKRRELTPAMDRGMTDRTAKSSARQRKPTSASTSPRRNGREPDSDTGIGSSTTCSPTSRSMASARPDLDAKGDLRIDDHHTVEDVGIALGQAVDRALGDRPALYVYGHGSSRWTKRSCSARWTSRGEALSVASWTRGGTHRRLCGGDGPEFLGRRQRRRNHPTFRQLAGLNGHHIVEAAFESVRPRPGTGRARSERVKGSLRLKGVRLTDDGRLGRRTTDDQVSPRTTCPSTFILPARSEPFSLIYCACASRPPRGN